VIVATEVWFVYRRHFVAQALRLRGLPKRRLRQRFALLTYRVLTLGSYDIGDAALRTDERATRILAAAGIPVALFLHGYAGFIFGSVKANALWMTPLMPVIFIVSAVVSGVAFCLLIYIVTMEAAKLLRRRRRTAPQDSSSLEMRGVEVEVVRITARYLLVFLVLAVSLELLDVVFRRYTAVKSWDVVRSAVYGNEFRQVFVLQYGIGNLIPLILLLIPRLSIKRAIAGSVLVLFGVFMMRWNVVVGGQSFSLTLAGYMHYLLPIVPDSIQTLKEGLVGALAVITFPLVLFYMLSRVCPVLSPLDAGDGLREA
jgi:Ni/Fe-hydrogenase subunit HybB-like protein